MLTTAPFSFMLHSFFAMIMRIWICVSNMWCHEKKQRTRVRMNVDLCNKMYQALPTQIIRSTWTAFVVAQRSFCVSVRYLMPQEVRGNVQQSKNTVPSFIYKSSTALGGLGKVCRSYVTYIMFLNTTHFTNGFYLYHNTFYQNKIDTTCHIPSE